MEHLKWSQSEKRLSRSVFEHAVAAELAELITEFKRRAADIRTPEEMWSLREYLESAERDFETKYDFRYSQLLFVFGRLVRERRITMEQLHGLSEDKLEYIRRIVSL